ncbi:olfactory receptor 52K2-like [Mugil cephalus]|uniref:olfactory receptor 52K2-like n=1 Tax=Mugil cephalus TaxID=48193 RepID=UPI001FB70527|nr:olfactory receptor 52K2-like [Mugil cephalus]
MEAVTMETTIGTYPETCLLTVGKAAKDELHDTFVFRGFPELQHHHRLLALPFSASYLLVLLGNSLLVYVIRSVERLHSPMYLLICMLCVVDVLVVTAILPNMLLGLLFDLNRISLAGCLTQMFFTHFLSSVESTLLLAMALDRYVAICKPLRYAELMDWSALAKLLLFTLVRSVSIMATLVGLAGSLRFCGSNIIQHCYCDHMALVSLACGSTTSSSAAGLAVIVCFVGVDIPLIFLSYVKILSVVLRAAAGEDRWKAFHTCGTHLMVMMCFYLVGSVTFLSHNLSIPIPTGLNTLLGLLYILLPATVNPIIYGVRTKEIRSGFLTIFRLRAKKMTLVKVSPAGKEQTGQIWSLK